MSQAPAASSDNESMMPAMTHSRFPGPPGATRTKGVGAVVGARVTAGTVWLGLGVNVGGILVAVAVEVTVAVKVEVGVGGNCRMP